MSEMEVCIFCDEPWEPPGVVLEIRWSSNSESWDKEGIVCGKCYAPLRLLVKNPLKARENCDKMAAGEMEWRGKILNGLCIAFGVGNYSELVKEAESLKADFKVAREEIETWKINLEDAQKDNAGNAEQAEIFRQERDSARKELAELREAGNKAVADALLGRPFANCLAMALAKSRAVGKA